MSGGKTYTCVSLMLNYIRSGHIVVTNVVFNCRAVTNFLGVPCVLWKQYYYFLNDDLELASRYHYINLYDYNNYPCGSLRGSSDYESRKVYIFLDEASSIFDSMVHASDSGVQAVATWARHSEKRGQILYLIMQFPSELHKRLRVHITNYIMCLGMKNYRLPFFGIPAPRFLHPFIVHRVLMADGETQLGSSKWERLDPRVYACYNTGQIVVHKDSFSLVAPTPPKLDFTLDVWRGRFFVVLSWFLILFLCFVGSLFFMRGVYAD